VTSLFLTDAAYDKSQRREIEARIATLRARRWSEAEDDRREIDAQIVMLEAVLASLNRTNGDGRGRGSRS
jgi:hypothetical protein